MSKQADRFLSHLTKKLESLITGVLFIWPWQSMPGQQGGDAGLSEQRIRYPNSSPGTGCGFRVTHVAAFIRLSCGRWLSPCEPRHSHYLFISCSLYKAHWNAYPQPQVNWHPEEDFICNPCKMGIKGITDNMCPLFRRFICHNHTFSSLKSKNDTWNISFYCLISSNVVYVIM